MKASELTSVLSELSALFRAGGATQSAKDVELLASRLEATGRADADAAIEKLENELAPSALPPTPEEYVSAFRGASLNVKLFDQVYAQFRNDRSINKAGVIAVMHGYVGPHARAKTKTDAFSEIRRHFSKLLYDANTQKQAATTPW